MKILIVVLIYAFLTTHFLTKVNNYMLLTEVPLYLYKSLLCLFMCFNMCRKFYLNANLLHFQFQLVEQYPRSLSLDLVFGKEIA